MSPVATAHGTDLDRALLDMLGALVERAPLFADLRARGEAEDLVQEAMIAVRARMDRGPVDDPFAYATRVVQNLARRAYVRRRPEDPLPEEDLALLGGRGDVAGEVEQRFALAEVLEMVRGVTAVVRELPPVDLEIVRAELRRDDQRALAGRLGFSRATFYRRKRHAVMGFVSAIAGGAGAAPCPDRAEALLAAAGDSGFPAAVQARGHAEDCPSCATTLRHLTAARHGLALLSPLPALAVVSDGAGDRLATMLHGTVEWARGLVVRAPDPVAMLPASKTAAVVAAACIGVGGGASCAVNGMPGVVRGALGLHAATAAPKTQAASASAGAGAGAVAPAQPVAAAPRSTSTATPVPIPAAGARRRAAGGEFRPPGGGADREFGAGSGTATARAVAAAHGPADREFSARPARARASRAPGHEFAAAPHVPAAAVAARAPAAPQEEFGAPAAGGGSPAGDFGG